MYWPGVHLQPGGRCWKWLCDPQLVCSVATCILFVSDALLNLSPEVDLAPVWNLQGTLGIDVGCIWFECRMCGFMVKWVSYASLWLVGSSCAPVQVCWAPAHARPASDQLKTHTCNCDCQRALQPNSSHWTFWVRQKPAGCWAGYWCCLNNIQNWIKFSSAEQLSSCSSCTHTQSG